MQPLKLTVRGFTSLKSEQEIDFTQLDSLFVITGPHGAGKSSLLDAVAFALFGKVARNLNPRDLLSQGRDRLAVRFEFELAGDRYKVVRDYDFKTKSGKTFVSLEILDDSQKWRSTGIDTIKGIDRKVSELLGIDPDTFFKIVLLPQGEFAAFLNGTPTQRKAILEKLFPEFGIFKRMAELATEKTSALDAQRDWIASQLTRLQAPTADELAAQTALAEDRATELAAAVAERDRLAAELKATRELVAKVAELASREAELARLQERAATIDGDRAALEAARQAALLEVAWCQIDAARTHRAAAATRTEAAVRTWESARQAFTERQARLEARQGEAETLTAREAALEAAVGPAQARDRAASDWQEAQVAWQERQATLETARQEHDRALESVEERAAQQAKARTEMERHAPGSDDRLATLQGIVRHLLPQWEALQRELTANAADCQQTRATLDAGDRAWETARSALAVARQGLADATAACDAARNREAAALLRANLQAGDPCPVCNGTFGGHPSEQLALSELPALLDSQQTCSDRLETARQEANRAEIALTQARERHRQAETTRLQLQEQITDLGKNLSTQLGTSSWDAAAIATECQQLEVRAAAYQSALESHAEADRAWQDARAHWQLLQQQLASATREADRAGTILEAKAAARDRADATLAAALADLHRDLGDLPFPRLQETLIAARQAFDRQWERDRDAYEGAREAQIRSETEAKAAREALDAAESQQARCDRAWTAALAPLTWSEADFLGARLPEDRVRDLTAAIETYDRQERDLAQEVSRLQAEIGDRPCDPATLAALDARWQASQAACTDLERQRQELALQIERGRRDRAEAATLATQKQELDRQLDIAETLKKELSGRNFQRYLQDALQGDLLASASQKLEQLSDRYGLATDGSGNYLVEDRWNGGERRKVSSLSGGETFMASLAMALALGDLLAGGSQIGSLFLDEGFGSLDSEAIETAISTLENLRRGDRLVGIITHVKAVADRIPSQIQVVKSEQGSTVKIV